MQARFFYSFVLILLTRVLCAQSLSANAGPDFTLCPNDSAILGSSVPASGGLPPYSFLWSPATGLSSNSVANPTVAINVQTTYTLSVRDSNDSLATDVVTVFTSDLLQYTAGNDTAYCPGTASNIVLGNPINASATLTTFSWSPTTGLNNPAAPNPVANPSVTTSYSLIVTKDGCSAQTGVVTITLLSFNLNFAFKDTVIKEGETITLICTTSAASYSWTPLNSYIKYANTGTPDVNPNSSTTYTLIAVDVNGCVGVDTVRVRVTPDDELVFYSAFTPNADGDNDFFYIGNIFKYPENILKIYNRYGQIIFTSAGYKNDWDGSYQGNNVPTGTYFYILYTNTEKGNYTGSVTILR
jgi:gliding motility-associated-like protein